MPTTSNQVPDKGLLSSVAPNGVQALNSFRVQDLQEESVRLTHLFLHARFDGVSSKQQVLAQIAEAFHFPDYFGNNLDALADCLTDMTLDSQLGFVVVLEQLPKTPEFNGEVREILLEVFQDVAEFWADQNVPFRVFYSFE